MEAIQPDACWWISILPPRAPCLLCQLPGAHLCLPSLWELGPSHAEVQPSRLPRLPHASLTAPEVLRLVTGGSNTPLQPCAAGRALGSWGCWEGRVFCACQPSGLWTCAACAVCLVKRPAVSGVCCVLWQSAVRQQGVPGASCAEISPCMDFKYVATPWENKHSLDASLLCYLFVLHLVRVAASWSVPQTPATANVWLCCFPSCQEFPWLFIQSL